MAELMKDFVAITNDLYNRHGKEVMVAVYENKGGAYQWEITSADGHLVVVVDANTLEEGRARAAEYFDVGSVKRYVPPVTDGTNTNSAAGASASATTGAATQQSETAQKPATTATATTTTTTTAAKATTPTWLKRVTDAMAKFQEARKVRDANKAKEDKHVDSATEDTVMLPAVIA